MEIILKEDVMGLGEEGDIKNVAPGFARNYLIPKGFAIPKNRGNLKWLERQQKAIENRRKEKAEAARGIAGSVDGAKVTIMGKVASSDRLYGSIHTHQIAEALKEQGFEIDHRKIEIHHPIKALGEYDITIKLYEGVQATVKLTVVPDEDSAPLAPAPAPAPAPQAVASAPEAIPAAAEPAETSTEENTEETV